ncbi:MAG: hypothetical protein U1E42_13475 [Rhodospirillales bacterium]
MTLAIFCACESPTKFSTRYQQVGANGQTGVDFAPRRRNADTNGVGDGARQKTIAIMEHFDMRVRKHVAKERVVHRDASGLFFLTVILLTATLVALG